MVGIMRVKNGGNYACIKWLELCVYKMVGIMHVLGRSIIDARRVM